MKALLLTLALVAGLNTPAAAASWGYPGLRLDLQAQQGRPGGGQDRAQPGRDNRQDRRGEREERRERLSDEERRALHRDLDKANREIYQGRRK